MKSKSQSNLNKSEGDQSLDQQLYRQMLLIRYFEERVLNEFSKGELAGTAHTYIGQEANAVGILSAVDPNDVVFSNHRCHGHYIAHGGDIKSLAAEIMGKAAGLCGGRGGSQHIYSKNFYTNGIQGGIVPCATGAALAEKEGESGHIVLVFIGDGTLGEGVVYESLNLASLWTLPILFVIENNRIAQTTPIHLALAGSIAGRMKAFGIEHTELDTTDVLTIRNNASQIIDQVRHEMQPQALILHTYRLGPHSKGDDTRDQNLIDELQTFDPLDIHGQRLTQAQQDQAATVCDAMVDRAFFEASTGPLPLIDDLSPAIELLT